MDCPRCGLNIREEEQASFCPRCGEPLNTRSTNLSFERGGTLPPRDRGAIPSQPIHEAPTQISAGSLPDGSRLWGSNYGQPPNSPETPATNTAFYGADVAADQQPARAPIQQPAIPPPAAPRKTSIGRVALGILLFVIVFASGVGVGILVGKPQSQPTPIASKAPTPTPIPSPTATPVEHIIFTDPLTAPAYPWRVDVIHCLFKGGSYHIFHAFICSAPVGVQSDVAVSVQVKLVAGNVGDAFGINLRFTSTGNFYDFLITSNSTWRFVKDVNSKAATIISDTSNAAIKPGLNTSNTLLVRVKGAHFDFFVNGIQVGEANDSTFSAGLVGLIGAEKADAAFNNFQVATLT